MVLSCQIVDDSAPEPDESFIKYYGDLTTYEARDIELLQDSSSYVVFGDELNATDGRTDFSIWRINSDGVRSGGPRLFSFDIPLGTDEDENGEEDVLRGNGTASQIEVYDGGFAVVGTTEINDNSRQIFNVKVANIAFLDVEFNLVLDTIITFPAGAPEDGLDFFGSDIIRTQDENFLFVGSREIDRGNGVTDFDYQLIKLGANIEGNRVIGFSETINISGDGQDDFAVRVFEKNDGNIVIIGYTEDKSDFGENSGNNGTNVSFTELTSEGKLLNNRSYGLDNPGDGVVFNEVVNDAVLTSSGIAIAGTTTLATEESYAFFMNLTQSGIFLSGDTLTSSFGFGIETQGNGIVQTIGNDFIILGSYNSLTIDQQSRLGEAMFMKVDQSGNPVSGSEVNYGTIDGSDSAIDGLLLPDGKISVLANIDFGGGVRLLSLIKTDDNGQLEN